MHEVEEHFGLVVHLDGCVRAGGRIHQLVLKTSGKKQRRSSSELRVGSVRVHDSKA